MQDKIVFVSVSPSRSSKILFAGGHLCTFVSRNCVNVPVSLQMTIISPTSQMTLKVLCVGFSNYCIDS